MTPCPIGKYSISRGASSLSDCKDCPGGKFCSSVSMSTNLVNCSAGYYCPFGSTVANPVQYICPAGYRCPSGSLAPMVCLAGTYQPNTGASTCLECPEVNS